MAQDTILDLMYSSSYLLIGIPFWIFDSRSIFDIILFLNWC